MRILATGRHGQVVSSLNERAPARGHEVVTIGRPELDLGDPTNADDILTRLSPDVIVSAAAYTAVDKAEAEPDIAFAVNSRGTEMLARAAAARNIPFIHISTDYVFDGSADRPYREQDPTAPLGVYGRSKLEGERAVARIHPGNSVILRTAWVYSPFGANFVKTMLRLAKDRDTVSVVCDQVGNPTSALAIADAILSVGENLAGSGDPALRGLFHMTAAGETSWAGFAERIFAASARLGGPAAQVLAIPSSEYPTPAKRPANSRLDCSKLLAVHGVRLPDWEGDTDKVVSRLMAEDRKMDTQQ